MFKAISEKFLSLWPNQTNNIDNVSVGSKRKLYNHECDFGNSDPGAHVNSGRKKRRTSEASDITLVGTIKTSVCNMAQWLRPKSKRFSEEFSIIQKEPSIVRGGASASNNGDHFKTSELLEGRYSMNHRFAVPHNIPYHPAGEPSNGSVNDQRRNGIGRNFSRRSSGSSAFQRHRPSTASMCIRLKEKEEFKKLLKLHSLHSPWQQSFSHGLPAASSSANDVDVISISSKSSDDEHLHKTSYMKMTAKPDQDIFSIPKHKVTPNVDSTLVRKNILKPFQRESLLTMLCEQRRRSGLNVSYQKPATESYRSSEDRGTLTSKIRNDHSKANSDFIEKKGPPSTQPEPVIVIDDGDDDDDETQTSQKSTLNTQTAAFRKDSLQRKAADYSFPQSILMSKYMNDKDMENERRAQLEEQRRRKILIEEEEMKAKAFAEKRRAQEISLDRSLKYQMRIFDDEPEVCEDIFKEEEETEEKLPELTSEMEAVIDNALKSGNPDQVLSEDFRLQITRRDIKTLSGLNWLNDEVINFYMNLLMRSGEQGERSKLYAFNTFFYPKIKSGGHVAVKRWTKNVNIFAVRYIIIPVHLGVHWCLCVADMEQKVITYYDSMGAKNNKCLCAVLQYINDESVAKGYSAFKREEWELVNAEDNPQQMNGGDCGMFMCMYAEFITRGKEITFTQEDMPYFRRRMVYEIIQKKLLH